MDRKPGINIKEVQALLERGYQECLHHTLKVQTELESLVKKRSGFATLLEREIRHSLTVLAPKLYRVMTDTLFRLIPMLQPECKKERQIHLYFWPGYHSCLAGRRIFIRRKNWNLGVGICASPTAEKLEHYCDSAQARLYHYMVRPRNKSNVFPLDVHKWLLHASSTLGTPDNQNWRIPINSLTVLGCKPTKGLAGGAEFFSNEILDLAGCGSSEYWGKCFAEFVYRRAVQLGEDELFAKQTTVELDQNWSTVASQKMQSIWLHSLFKRSKPEWLQSFLIELADHEVTRMAAISLKAAMSDPIIEDWRDSRSCRPKFCSWTNISLRPSLDPTKLYSEELADDEPEPNRRLAGKTVGSAEFLSSVPLGATYFSFVRPWISEIYSTVRNAEIAMWMHKRKLGEREQAFAGPYITHEIRKLVDSGLYVAKGEVHKTSEEAVRNREFLLHSIGALTKLAYAFTNAVLSMNKQALQTERQRFLTPLITLKNDGRLDECLTLVAKEIYESVRSDKGGKICFPARFTDRWNTRLLDVPQQSSCFLLTVEMISNYCQKEDSTATAYWNVSIDDKAITIRLEGPTSAQRNPTSTSFARLDVFLRALEIGEANVFWKKLKKQCCYTVKVNLAL